ncbi:MAG: EamA family transporter RarD [Acidimicrobiia bacterium]|nr:EamA family transporter RarD [Acidimicrobiia bacterium]
MTDLAAERRVGTLAGVAAYGIWGLFPIMFHALRSVGATEILVHRIVWSCVVVLIILAFRGDRHWYDAVRHHPRGLSQLALAGVLIAINWWVYIWAVNHDRVLEAALGYYINPLITVALGVIVLREQLRRPQYVALALGLAAVAVLTLVYGEIPWIALTLATSFAAYGFLNKAVSVDATSALAVQTGVLLPFALVAGTVLILRGDAAVGQGTLSQDALLLALGVVTAVPLLLFGTAARRIPLSELGLLQYITPTMQLVCGIAIFHEDLPPERFAGFILIWLALFLLGADAIRVSRTPATVPTVRL